MGLDVKIHIEEGKSKAGRVGTDRSRHERASWRERNEKSSVAKHYLV